MIIEVPAYDFDQPPDDSKPKDLTHESKAVFHWPPDLFVAIHGTQIGGRYIAKR